MNKKTHRLVVLSLSMAIIIIMTFTPFGYIMLPPPLFPITIIHIVVITMACVEDWKFGAILGACWGITSMMYAVYTGSPMIEMYLNPLVTVMPRVLVGIFAGLTYHKLTKIKKPLRVIVASIVGSFTNTILFLSMAYLLYFESYVEMMGTTAEQVSIFFLFTSFLNGIPEAAAACIVCSILVPALEKVKRRKTIQEL